MDSVGLTPDDTMKNGLNEVIDINKRETLYLQYMPSNHFVDKQFTYPIVQIPLLGELGAYGGYYLPDLKIDTSHIPKLDNSWLKYLKQQDEKIVTEKQKLIQEQENYSKRSSLLTNLHEFCSLGVEKHKKYIDTLMKGDEKSDYFSMENVAKYEDEFIPKCADAIAITMSDLIHSDKLNPDMFMDRATKEPFHSILKKIKDPNSKNKAVDFFRLVSIGSSVIKQSEKERKIKIVAPRRGSTIPTVYTGAEEKTTAETQAGFN